MWRLRTCGVISNGCIFRVLTSNNVQKSDKILCPKLLYLMVLNDQKEQCTKLPKMYLCIITLIFSVPLEMPVLLKENFNRWYSLRSYYLAITLSDIPFQVSFPFQEYS